MLIIQKYNTLKKKLLMNKLKPMKIIKLPTLLDKKKVNKHYPLKKQKKWANWRQFKAFFLIKKKIKFFSRLKWRYNNMRILWHQLTKMYVPSIKKLISKWKRQKNSKFYILLNQLELRLSTLLIRARFCFKLINASNAIKFNLIRVNGFLINRIWYLANILDLIEKLRTLKIKTKKIVPSKIRVKRYKWRRYHWNKSKYVLWKVRRTSHFNLFLSKKQNIILNYLEINYKLPGFIIIKQPFIKELYLNQEIKTLTNSILKKIYFLY